MEYYSAIKKNEHKMSEGNNRTASELKHSSIKIILDEEKEQKYF